jgi:acetyltransferase-like isoleucine patch superfamily enzyme
LGKRVYIASGAKLIATRSESISIGDDTFILEGSLLYPYGGFIKIGSRCSLNPYCVVYGHGGLEIGNDVLIATSCIFIPANHVHTSPNLPIRSQGLECKGIKIEDDVWLGARVTVLDGVSIGKGSVIGAGSVVTKTIPAYSIAVGVPARVIRNRLESRNT